MTLAFVSATVAWIIGIVLLLGWLLYLFVNLRQSRAEIGAEVELAANRKPYLSDEELEGKKLERTQVLGLAMLVIVAVGLPLYWLQEPGRQAGAIPYWDKKLAGWGAADFATTAEGGFNCAGCHGGMTAGGGVAPFTITDPTTGEVTAVNWAAPALNTVLYRFSESEVRYILVYGRPFSPMSPWGTAGGGPMNDQQIDNIINYLKSIQVPQEGCTAEDPFCNGPGAPINTAYTDEVQKAAEQAVADGKATSIGQALFNLDLAGGANNCARCHTKGWSWGDPQQSGGGAMGPNLTGGSTVRQFPDRDEHISFVGVGSENGKRYGVQGQGSGRMPGFNAQLTEEQIAAIVDYERGL
jgi:mono/diheme cytochrome c family protein